MEHNSNRQAAVKCSTLEEQHQECAMVDTQADCRRAQQGAGSIRDTSLKTVQVLRHFRTESPARNKGAATAKRDGCKLERVLAGGRPGTNPAMVHTKCKCGSQPHRGAAHPPPSQVADYHGHVINVHALPKLGLPTLACQGRERLRGCLRGARLQGWGGVESSGGFAGD